MFIFNDKTGKMYNLDKIVDIFPGQRTPGDVSIGLEGGSIAVFAKYETEIEAREMIAMLAESMAVSKRDISVTPGSEEIKARIRSKPEKLRHHATGKKTKGYGGS